MGRGEDARIECKQASWERRVRSRVVMLGGVLQSTLSVLYPSLNNSLYNLPLMGKGDRRKATVDEV